MRKSVREFAEEVVVCYIIATFAKNDKFEFTPEEISEEFGKLSAEHAITGLVEKGFIYPEFDEDGEITYRKTEAAEKWLKHKNVKNINEESWNKFLEDLSKEDEDEPS